MRVAHFPHSLLICLQCRFLSFCDLHLLQELLLALVVFVLKEPKLVVDLLQLILAGGQRLSHRLASPIE